MAVRYQREEKNKLNEKLQSLLLQLPKFCENFFRGVMDTMQIKTRIAYALDLRIFFYYLYNHDPKFKDRKDSKDFTAEDLDMISAIDIEKFSEFLSYYEMPKWDNQEQMVTYSNSQSGKMRKLSTLRSFYKYYYKKEIIKNNPTVLVDLPKLKEKTIVRLETNESADLLDAIETGEFLTERSKKISETLSLAQRDLAIISLLLGTGIRISECVGIDISDINFKDDSFVVTRKGGDQAILYMPLEVKETLQKYYDEVRSEMIPVAGHENAFFLSSQKKRIGVRSVQMLLNKYTSSVVPLKRISPHKLRSTYGTNLYNETGDIYLVAEVLGHSDINTTRKHYTVVNEDRKRSAAKATKLRKD